MKPKKLMCFTHWDLDGIVSYLVLRWAFPNAEIECRPTNVQKFRETYTKWLSCHDLEDYDTVYIMDLGIYEDKDLIDHDNVFIIDHHAGHNSDTYKKAKCAIKSVGSASFLAYKVFKELHNIKLSRDKVYLILLANDFDSYVFNDKNSKKLDIVFWQTNDKFKAFTSYFADGFKGFSKEQLAMIDIFYENLAKIKANLEVYSGNIKIENEERYVCATFATKCINDVADILIKDYNADIAIIVNAPNEHVSYRKNKKCGVDLAKFANKIAGGSGHEFSSGSKLNADFELFTRLLNKI